MNNLMSSQNASNIDSKTKSLCSSVFAGSIISTSLFLTSCTTLPASSTQAATQPPKAPVVALVLGGGGAKGFAHIGVIKALEAHNIRPNLVVGTSVGSFVGSIYASGKTASELEYLALTTRDSDLSDFTLSYQGVIEGQKLRNFINNQVNNIPMQSFPIRFGAVAAEKHTLKKAIFTEGEAGLAVQASCSVPNIFISPRIPDPATSGIVGKKYVDGGVISIVPVDAAKYLGADVVIAVDLQVDQSQKKQPSTSSFSGRTIWSLIEQGYNTYINANAQNQKTRPYTANYEAINKAEINRANVVIRPDIADISPINTIDREKAIAAGVKATEQSLPAIIEAIKKAEANYPVKAIQ